MEEFEIVTNLDCPDSVSLYKVDACLCICSVVFAIEKLYGGSYMIALVLLNLLNKLRKRDKMVGFSTCLINLIELV